MQQGLLWARPLILFIYLLIFISTLSKFGNSQLVDVPASFSAAGEWPCLSSVACEASSVTELGPLHAHSFS